MNIKEFIFGKKRTVQFSTLLPESECISRLNGLLPAKGTIWIGGSPGEIVGRVKGSTFLIWKNAGRNSWKPQYRGELKQTGKSTIIDGSFDIQGFTKGLMYFWFGFGLVMLLTSSIALFVNGVSADKSIFPVGCIGELVFGALVSRLGIWIGEKQQQSIIELIKKTLEAKQINVQAE
jgi:hypothetical protein